MRIKNRRHTIYVYMNTFWNVLHQKIVHECFVVVVVVVLIIIMKYIVLSPRTLLTNQHWRLQRAQHVCGWEKIMPFGNWRMEKDGERNKTECIFQKSDTHSITNTNTHHKNHYQTDSRSNFNNYHSKVVHTSSIALNRSNVISFHRFNIEFQRINRQRLQSALNKSDYYRENYHEIEQYHRHFLSAPGFQ